MKNTFFFSTIKIFKYTILLGIVACFSHFAYELSGRNPMVGSHFLKYSTPHKWVGILSVIVIVSLFVMFVVFTIKPPELPMFFDNSN